MLYVYHGKTILPVNSDDPIFDCGSTHHIWNHMEHFTTFTPYIDTRTHITLANGTNIPIHGNGTIGLLQDVLYVPNLTHCLISSSALSSLGYTMTLNTSIMVTSSNSPTTPLFQGILQKGLYHISRGDFERQLHLHTSPPVCPFYITPPCHTPRVMMMQSIPLSSPTLSVKCSDPIFDCGCTTHMWNHPAHFTTYTTNSDPNYTATLANGSTLPILGKGDIGPLKDVLYAPDLTHCLISARALVNQGYEMTTGRHAIISKIDNPTDVLLRGNMTRGLYQITKSEFEQQLGIRPVICLLHTVQTQPLLHLHQLLGHASAERCAYECKCHKFPGLSSLSTRAFQAIRECEECALAKSTKSSFSGHLDAPEFIGQIWYVDVKGPVQTPSIVHENHYVFGIIDAKTKFLIQYFMKTKDEVLHYFTLFHDHFIPYIREMQPQLKSITVFSDMGEFHSLAVRDYCASKGINHMTTNAYSPQQNGIIERVWRTISEGAVAMLLTANLPENYWEEARSTAGYIRNRITGGHPTIDPLSPYEKFFGRKPHIRHFRVFGVFGYAHIPVKLKNHDPKATQGIFVGYDDHKMGGFKLYLPKTNEFIVSSHVHFGKSPNRTVLLLEDTSTQPSTDTTTLDLRRLQAENLQRVLIEKTPPPSLLTLDLQPVSSNSTDLDSTLP